MSLFYKSLNLPNFLHSRLSSRYSLQILNMSQVYNPQISQFYTLRGYPRNLFYDISSFCEPSNLPNFLHVATYHRGIVSQISQVYNKSLNFIHSSWLPSQSVLRYFTFITLKFLNFIHFAVILAVIQISLFYQYFSFITLVNFSILRTLRGYPRNLFYIFSLTLQPSNFSILYTLVVTFAMFYVFHFLFYPISRLSSRL